MRKKSECIPGPLCEHRGYCLYGSPTIICPEYVEIATRAAATRRRGSAVTNCVAVVFLAAFLLWLSVPKLLCRPRSAKHDLGKAAVGRSGPIAKGLEAYQRAMGRYPSTTDGLAALYQDGQEISDENYKGPYLQRKFTDLRDPWGQPFMYQCPGAFNKDGYDLWSKGPDRRDNSGAAGGDDIKNWRDP